ncbi:MAG TPA: hypothetical protein VKE40_20455 [Gemmataceae bacterium]|nr:hypothetical protein [Gemmataceae bacterium]
MRTRFLVPLLALSFLAGCRGSGEEKYIPAEATARQALETALGQWRDGQAKPARFTQGKVNVEVLDQAWSSGQKIQGFDIVAEETAPGGPRVYSVKLKTAKGEHTMKYYVVGIDPLWVYSEPDYRKQAGG